MCMAVRGALGLRGTAAMGGPRPAVGVDHARRREEMLDRLADAVESSLDLSQLLPTVRPTPSRWGESRARAFMKELILGGVRSGKSRSPSNGRDSGLQVVYIATAIAALDTELDNASGASRAPSRTWTVVENRGTGRCAARPRLAAALPGRGMPDAVLTNLLCTAAERFERERLSLLDTLPHLRARSFWSATRPASRHTAGALSRRFVDASGEYIKAGAICDRVTLAVAGLPFP